VSILPMIAGTWVRDDDMPPWVNVAGRRFWARGNIEGTFNGYWPTPDGLRPRDLWWHFPSHQEGEAPSDTPPPAPSRPR
jgi:hypothetical protein